MEVSVNKNELNSLIKKAVREVLQEETINFFLRSIPPVSKEEMEDIEKLYGKPKADKEAVDSETIEL